MTETVKKACLFCPVRENEIVATHPLAVALRDNFPLTPGHTLVVPLRHVASFFDTTPEERMAMMELLDRAKAIIDEKHGPDGYNIGINNGKPAGQTVMHVHMHLTLAMPFCAQRDYWRDADGKAMARRHDTGKQTRLIE